MATTGEKLVELSSLTTGTALEHLLAITTGGGTGPGETVFVGNVAATVAGELRAELADDTIHATIDDQAEAELAEDTIAGKVN